MGQKTNPIGFRLGVSRKWGFSWYTPSGVRQSHITDKSNAILLSKGVVRSQGGAFVSSIEEIVYNFFRRYAYTRKNKTRRFLPITFQHRKGGTNHVFFFFFYRKIKGRRSF